MRKITIKEIASEMGLSRNTVAKALSGSDVVSYNTRCAVIEKAKEMGYQKLPSNAVRMLSQMTASEAKTVVVLAHSEISVFWNEIILGVSEELKNNGYKLQFNFVSEKDEMDLILPLDWEEETVGIILLSVFSQKFVENLVDRTLPIVFLDSPVDTNKVREYGDVVICEGKDCVRQIVGSLVNQGMKKIGFIGDITYCKTVHERYEGYVAAMTSAGLTMDEKIIITRHVKNKYYSIQEIEEAVNKMPYLPEAIVCANDDVALNVIRTLKARNIRVPEDVAVTGYDNIESLTHVDPFLTTVNVSNQLLGRRLVQQMMFRLRNPEFATEVIQVGAETILRKSSIKKR